MALITGRLTETHPFLPTAAHAPAGTKTATPPKPMEAAAIAAEAERLGEGLGQARDQIGTVIFGQRQVVDLSLISILAGGHILLLGVPGLAKTRLVETLGSVLGLDYKRIQCTPDLMPADILGSEVLDEGKAGKRAFRFIEGPIFTQLLMADEINRASPRTQSALLQAMQENSVSVAGHTHALPQPFYVLATQNPLEQEGTYPLPEAQLDRFLMQITVDYPDREAERAMLLATTGTDVQQAASVLSEQDLMMARHVVRALPVGEQVVEAILDLVRIGRPEDSSLAEVTKHVAWGPGPRAAQAMMLACRAKALLEGRLSPSLDDVRDLARPILQHRMALNFGARADGLELDDVIERMLTTVL